MEKCDAWGSQDSLISGAILPSVWQDVSHATRNNQKITLWFSSLKIGFTIGASLQFVKPVDVWVLLEAGNDWSESAVCDPMPAHPLVSRLLSPIKL